MKWFTKSHELLLFLISFVLFVDGIRGDERNRMDAEQDSFETVTLADDGGVSSALFGRCIAAARTLKVKFFSLEVPGTGNEFTRYVPDSWQLSVSPEWKTVASNPPVATIMDCAEAANRGTRFGATYQGNAMFKYSGGSNCQVSNRTYDLSYTPACEAEAHDAVFISSFADMGCSLPGTKLFQDIALENSACATVHTVSLSFDDAKKLCQSKSGEMFDGPRGMILYDNIVQILKAQKVESSNFMVDAYFEDNTWKWTSNGTAIDPLTMAAAPSTSADDIVFMSGAAGFKLDFAPLGLFTGGVVCLKTGDGVIPGKL